MRLLLLFVVATLPLSVRPSLASCSPPEVTVRPAEVRPGGLVHISGVGWAASCDEPRDRGCGGDDRPAASPVTGIEVTLVLTTGGRVHPIELGTIDADDDYGFQLDVMVPGTTRPGRYRLDVRAADRVGETHPTVVVRRRSD